MDNKPDTQNMQKPTTKCPDFNEPGVYFHSVGDVTMAGQKPTKFNEIERKPQLSLIPLDLLTGLAMAFEYGLQKYSRNNFRNGIPQNASIDAAFRHLTEYFYNGQIYDKEAWEKSGLRVPHLGMAIFNLICATDAHENHWELVRMFVPEDYQSDVPLDDDEKEKIAVLRKKWATGEL